MLTVLGCDFTSRATRQKPITLAVASVGLEPQSKSKSKRINKNAFTNTLEIELHEILSYSNSQDFEYALSSDAFGVKAHWVGGFDLPFGLPRELVLALGWSTQWERCMAHFCSLERSEIRNLFKAFCDKRAVGSKFAHRASDYIAQSSPSMKWVNPPVAYMMHAGVPVLIKANLTLPGLRVGDPSRVGLEAYPGMLAREIVGNKSYKSDDKQKQNKERLQARHSILKALVTGKHSLEFKLKTSKALLNQMLEDASGDSLDALLCAVQAAWGAVQFEHGDEYYGLAKDMDPLEGWILTC